MNLVALLNHRFARRTTRFTTRDTILYALSVGAGRDPTYERDLSLVYERELQALPTMAAVLAHPGMWIADPAFGVNVARLVHGEQRVEIARPLPVQAEVTADYAIRAVVDKGAGKGALVYFEKRVADAATGRPLCSGLQMLFLRDDGGCGSYGEPPDSLAAFEPSAADFVHELQTLPSAALLYRLNGDLNPLHVDPDAARAAGFERPILHGLCTYGAIGYLLTRAFCDGDASRLVSLAARFTAPVYPGETLRLEGNADGDHLHFRALVTERNQVVLSHGTARIN